MGRVCTRQETRKKKSGWQWVSIGRRRGETNVKAEKGLCATGLVVEDGGDRGAVDEDPLGNAV